MKRDFDLIRIILFYIEGDNDIDLSIYTKDQIEYHKALIVEAGFADGMAHYPSSHKTDIPSFVTINRLTWDGHEFIDKSRNDNIWNKSKSIISEKGIEISFDILKYVLTGITKSIFDL
jgi:hypothetical protein